ncbi:MAG: sodium:calcium symporter [Chthoniobacterales bacterium]|nr:sodium:calcium symporter [Chthoniobacterales bacterium]
MSGPAKENWSSKIGVILAVTGSAVGLGNFLRFPGLAAQYDGGIFMIPYFVSLFVLGLPLAWAEWAMGRHGGSLGFHSTPGIFRAIWKNRAAPYAGVLGLVVPVVIYMYYVFVESWCLGYAWHYLTGTMSMGTDPASYEGFFKSYVGLGENGSVFSNLLGAPFLVLVLCIALNFFLINRGLTRGIEQFCLWAMPTLAVCAVLVLVRVLTLGTPDPSKPELNVLAGLGEMWNPHVENIPLWKALANGEMWMEAAGQIFFSLSVGFGVIITYASYLKPKDDIALSSTTAVAGNEFFEVSLGGMITIPAAFVFLGAAGAAGGTFALGFNTLPLVFEHMPLGRVVGFLWFFLLFLAAITSSLSMLQPAIAFLEEGLGLSRSRAVAVLCGVGSAGTLFVVWFSKNLVALDTFDFWVGTFCIFLLATIQTLLFGWVFGTRRGLEEMDRGAEMRVPRVFALAVKYVSPVYLLAIFALWAWQKVGGYVQSFRDDATVRWSILFLLGVFALFLWWIRTAVKRWEAQEEKP